MQVSSFMPHKRVSVPKPFQKKVNALQENLVVVVSSSDSY